MHKSPRNQRHQAISYSITREKAPIYTMGSPDPRAYSRNKRGIAGSLIWINFDRHALLNLFYKAQGKFVADVDEIRPSFQQGDSGINAVYNSSVIRSVGPSIGDTIDKLDNVVTDIGSLNTVTSPWYSDQVLPFNVTHPRQHIVGVSVLPDTTPSRSREERKAVQTTISSSQVSRRPMSRQHTGRRSASTLAVWVYPPWSPVRALLEVAPGQVVQPRDTARSGVSVGDVLSVFFLGE
jgi:hypothetical protein